MGIYAHLTSVQAHHNLCSIETVDGSTVVIAYSLPCSLLENGGHTQHRKDYSIETIDGSTVIIAYSLAHSPLENRSQTQHYEAKGETVTDESRGMNIVWEVLHKLDL
jgi:hypothetical protein